MARSCHLAAVALSPSCNTTMCTILAGALALAPPSDAASGWARFTKFLKLVNTDRTNAPVLPQGTWVAAMISCVESITAWV